MKDTYVICANITQGNGTIVTGYLATDRGSGGCPYFSTSINNSEIRTFESIEAARKFIETDLDHYDEGWKPNAYWLDGVVGLRICEITLTNRYFYVLCNE